MVPSIALNYNTAVIGLILLQNAFDSYASQRQLGRLHHRSPPPSLRNYFNLLEFSSKKQQQDTNEDHAAGEKDSSSASSNFLASQEYAKDKIKLSRVLRVVDLIETLLHYTTFVSKYILRHKYPVTGLKCIWDYATSFDIVKGRGEIAQSLAFVTALYLLGQIAGIPASLYKPFVLEAKHGFNKMTMKTWITDFIKTQLLAVVLGVPLISAMLWTIQRAGPSFVTYMMLLIVAIQLIMIPAYPYLLAPIFNNYKPLSHPDFKEKKNYAEVAVRTEKLAKRLGFPLGKLWVMDGSKRSGHSNAFFYGLPYLTKHIVLYDTLLDQSTPEEVEAVLAHELGHWKFNHSMYMLAMSEVLVLTNLSLLRLSIFNPALYRAFSFVSQRPVIIGLIVSQALSAPVDTLTSFLVNAFSRHNEFEADKFALDLSNSENAYAENLKLALVKLGSENKSVTDVDPFYSAYHHSHPTMPERITRLDELISAANKKQ